MKSEIKIFLSYAREDETKVREIYRSLSDAGFKPWMDTVDIAGGEKWQNVIEKAIRESDFFIACISENSTDKRGFVQREIKAALDILDGYLENDIYIIPVRLDSCKVPESLNILQCVDLHRENGWKKLDASIKKGLERRDKLKLEIASTKHPYLIKDNDKLISWCDCKLGLIGRSWQADCPWCGCGWLFSCMICKKSFTFARAVMLEESWQKTAERMLQNRASFSSSATPTGKISQQYIQNWIDSTKAWLEGVELGEQYVYLDGVLIPTNARRIKFVGLRTAHFIDTPPQIAALENPSILDSILRNPDYWKPHTINIDDDSL